MKKRFDFFERQLIKFDLFGHKIDLYLNSKTVVKSKFGAFVSLALMGLCLFIFISNYIAWTQNQNLQTISASQSFTVQELLKNNQSFEFIWDYQNYNIYFLLSSNSNEGPPLYSDDLRNYFEQYLVYVDNKKVPHNINLEKCFDYKKDVFLLHDEKNTMNTTSISNKTLCMSENITNGLFSNEEDQMIDIPQLIYYVTICKNTTANNNRCASEDEIFKMLKNLSVQISIPKTIYDFKNINNPRKRIYDYKRFLFDENISKYYLNKVMPVYLYTDSGIFNEYYSLDYIDFNTDSLTTETFVRNDLVLFQFNTEFGMNQQIYYRKNDKIYDLFANFGGIVNILFIFGQLLCSSYNLLILRYQLINIIFSNIKSKGDSFNSIKNSFSFSFFSLICPKYTENKSYLIALKNIYEYMDIKNIIKRLQDIDKLKMVLLDDQQRKLFEILPKPGVGVKKNNNSIWTIDNIIESKKSIFNKDLFNNNAIFNGDPIYKRMYNILDPKFKSEISNKNESFYK